MKYIHNFNSFFKVNESQTKKLKKYFTFSVVLEWYRKNKELIAKTLGCEVSDLADEDTLMEQSYGVVNYVINPQVGGNEGRDNIDQAGFSSFDKLEKNLIHDILHNMYQVQSKEFNKSLQDIQYSESEIFEEIEVLGIEESFMKNMNIPYPKTDFINQNLNMLASYLMMSILKNDPTRIEKILDGEVEPYLEIYGKKYPVEGTPYENLFKLFKNDKADSKFDNNSSDDFKEYMIHLINVGSGIGENGGDRAQYPDFDYFGEEGWWDLEDDRRKNYIMNAFEQEKRYQKKKWILVDSNFIGTVEELEKKGLIINVLGEYQSEVNDPNQLKLFPEYEKDLEEKNKEKNRKRYKKYDDNLVNRKDLASIPMDRNMIDDDGYIDVDTWFDFLENKYEITLFKIDDVRYLGIEDDLENQTFEIYNEEEFEEYIIDEFESNDSGEAVSKDKEFINFEKYRQKSFSELASELMRDEDSRSILRRNFRTNDVIKNNTKIGNLYSGYWKSWKQEEVDTKNPKDKYIDFKGSDFAADKSISKNLLTDNGKRLIYLLNNLKGYFLKNIETIKANYKSKNKKFGNDISKFRNINLKNLKDMLDVVSKIDFEKETLTLDCKYGYGWSYDKEITIYSNDEINTIAKFLKDFKEIKEFKDKVKTKEDVEYLLNYVNEKGLLKTPKDFTKFKTFITKIRKYENKIENYPFIDVVKFIQTHKKINIHDDYKNAIKNYLSKWNESSEDIENAHLENDKFINETLSKMIKEHLKDLNIKSFKIDKITRWDIEFTITI